ncbi:hypothetical protein [Psychrobacter sp. Ps6]|uniref:hypothetical protein n=1 Tax=Psychrobacter sp. Ps6 TaxID=2790960 RepID=UPI001EDFFFE8|nr:hypothetical protein [Psychrobacter sp. Ps6]MCG3878284.1 hypothetical protein [Psychrobacter sp. Ps6]
MQMYIDFIDGSVKLMASQLPVFILISIFANRLIHNSGHTIKQRAEVSIVLQATLTQWSFGCEQAISFFPKKFFNDSHYLGHYYV